MFENDKTKPKGIQSQYFHGNHRKPDREVPHRGTKRYLQYTRNKGQDNRRFPAATLICINCNSCIIKEYWNETGDNENLSSKDN